MSVVRVAVPVLHGRRKFHFDKGRPWSVIEHVMLVALINNASTAAELADSGNLPKRVVIEALVRLMRAGWVEMLQKGTVVTFHATQNGAAAATLNELPNVPRRLSRNMNFVIDQITGTIYRSREFPFLHTYAVEERAQRETIVWLERQNKIYLDEVRPLVEALFLDDEKFVSVDASGDRLSERWSLVTVRDGEPDGLTHRAPAALIEAIKTAAKNKSINSEPGMIKSIRVPSVVQIPHDAMPQEHQANISSRDIVLGGHDHFEVFKSALGKARHRVLIHSTFISEDRFNELLPILRIAINRGVVVDILWGQAPQTEGKRSTRHAVKHIKEKLNANEFENLRIHPFSTESHCKILLADDGQPDQFSAYVGSCNWLSTQFRSFDASIRLREPAIVADVVDQMAELSKGARGIWTDLTNDLAALAANLRVNRPTANGRACAQVVIGPHHVELIRQARDKSQNRIFVVSHRFGVAGEPAVLAPALSAAKANGVSVNVFYGTTSGPLGGNDAASIVREADLQGVEIRPVRKPRIHAKLLAWDDDTIVITSQNWLSADPPDDRLRQEIGVCVNVRGIARSVIERFNAARLD